MSTTFTVTIRATSITVFPGQEASYALQPLLELMTYEDEYVEETRTLGYIYDTPTDTLYLHKGVDLNYLKRLLIDVEFVNNPYDDYEEMNFEYEEIIPPRNDEQVDVINFIAGLKQHAENINKRQLFLVKSPGFGKAEPYTRKIPTPTKQGYTLMGDIKVGDYVFDKSGNPTKVTAVFEQGVQAVYEVSFEDGRKAYCMHDHLWCVKTMNGPYQVLKLGDIINDYKSISKLKNDSYVYKYYIPTCSVVNYPRNNVPIDPWIIGCFIGNGCCKEKILTISSDDDTIPNRIANICEMQYKKHSGKNYSYIFYRGDKPVLTSEFFKDVPDMICCSSDKKIPECYLYNDISTRLSILRGIMDVNGNISIHKDRDITYSSTSKELLEQLRWLLYSFGFSGTLIDDTHNKKYVNGFCGTLIFDIPNQIKISLFTNPYKHSIAKQVVNKKQQRKYDSLMITDIKLVRQEKCKCIKVDNPEHLYLTEDFIVTHNTFCSGVGLCKFHAKTLIIMHRDSLRKQWLHSLYDMSGLSSDDVHEIVSSDELYDIAHNQHDFDYDVYLLTHATFRAGLKKIGNLKDASNITKNLGIGMKIIDEAHLEFRDTLIMDFIFNVCRNLYLTATDGRSAKEENSIFRHVFSNAIYYKPSSLLTSSIPDKWVEYSVVAINTHCKPNIYRYRVNGGRGMNPASYGKWVIQYDKKQTHFKVCRELLRIIYERDEKAKVLIFMPLIDLCSEAAHFCTMELNYDESFPYDLTIRTINSHNSKHENEMNKRADVIVTTIASCGTGTDIPGITDIICCSPLVSKINLTQVLGRIRYCGKICHYYDIYDVSVPMDGFWLKARIKTAYKLALSVNKLTWSDEDDNADVNVIETKQ
jgi:superfamily II DNA or RNA helicase